MLFKMPHWSSSKTKQFKTLKVETKRANKRFPLTSPEISATVGAYLLSATGTSADMHNPDLRCNIEIVDEAAYIYVDKIRGVGGLPCWWKRESSRHALWWD